VANLEILGFQNLNLVPLGYKYLVVSDASNRGLWTIYEVEEQWPDLIIFVVQALQLDLSENNILNIEFPNSLKQQRQFTTTIFSSTSSSSSSSSYSSSTSSSSLSSSPNGFIPILVQRSSTDWFLLHIEPVYEYQKIFVFSIEWILCHSAIIDQVINQIKNFSIEENFNLIQIPHAQIFPQPAPSQSSSESSSESSSCNLLNDEIPFGEKISIQWRNTSTITSIFLIASRIIERMSYLIIFYSREYSHPEGFSINSSNESTILSSCLVFNA
jgi:hypothetical protein